MNRISLAALLAGTALALGACGGSDDSPDRATDALRQAETASIRGVLAELQSASVSGDGHRICAKVFTPKLSALIASTAGSCAREVRTKLFSPDARLTVKTVDVTAVSDATATVKEANGNLSRIFFVKQAGRWRIRSVQAA